MKKSDLLFFIFVLFIYLALYLPSITNYMENKDIASAFRIRLEKKHKTSDTLNQSISDSSITNIEKK